MSSYFPYFRQKIHMLLYSSKTLSSIASKQNSPKYIFLLVQCLRKYHFISCTVITERCISFFLKLLSLSLLPPISFAGDIVCIPHIILRWCFWLLFHRVNPWCFTYFISVVLEEILPIKVTDVIKNYTENTPILQQSYPTDKKKMLVQLNDERSL